MNRFRFKGVLLLSSVLALLNACAIAPSTEKVALASLPQGNVVRNITHFEESLACMDQLFMDAGIKDVLIGSDGLPDATERIDVGGREILISTISRMASKSEAFRFVDYFIDRPLNGLLDLRNALDAQAEKLNPPNFFIGGAITQVDSSVIEATASGGFLFNNINTYIADLGIERGYVSSIISLDMHIGTFYSRQVVPGLEATNSIAITRTGSSNNLMAHFKLHAIPFSVIIDQSEGAHAAVRMLIQLSLIESLGKLAEVPYWQCLGLPSTDPNTHSAIYEIYRTLDEETRKAQIHSALTKIGYINNTGNRSLKEAIAHYQNDHNLIANGRIDFNLYFKLTQQQDDISIIEAKDIEFEVPDEPTIENQPQPQIQEHSEVETQQPSDTSPEAKTQASPPSNPSNTSNQKPKQEPHSPDKPVQTSEAEVPKKNRETVSQDPQKERRNLLSAIGLDEFAETDNNIDLSRLSPSLWVVFYDEYHNPSINSLGFTTEHRQLKQLVDNEKKPEKSEDLFLSQEEYQEICEALLHGEQKKMQMLLVREKDPESKIITQLPEFDISNCQQD